MSAFRILGLSYFAVVSVFALAIVMADQRQLRLAMDSATETASDAIGLAVIQPVLAFVRAEDEFFFDPPYGKRVLGNEIRRDRSPTRE